MLTPGVYNGAYFEHALLARTMGVELVEGRDLECRRGRVMMRTTQGLAPVHVIYRRIDDEFLDPVHFRADSVLGCPGLIDAARAGNVTLANAVGNGVADDKLVYTYLPDIIRYYLAEEPMLKQRRHLAGGRRGGPRGGARPARRARAQAGRRLRRQGHRDRARARPGPSSTSCAARSSTTRAPGSPSRSCSSRPCPTFVDGELGPRHVDLRPFAVNDGNRVWVLPGGLTRVALAEGELIVNSSRGGGSKDTWVLAGPPRPSPRPEATTEPTWTPRSRPLRAGPETHSEPARPSPARADRAGRAARGGSEASCTALAPSRTEQRPAATNRAVGASAGRPPC